MPLAQVVQYLVQVGVGVDFPIDLLNAALRIDQIADPGRILGIGRLGRPISHADRLVLVAQQIEGEFKLFLEPPVFFRRVAADADDDRVLGGKF